MFSVPDTSMPTFIAAHTTVSPVSDRSILFMLIFGAYFKVKIQNTSATELSCSYDFFLYRVWRREFWK